MPPITMEVTLDGEGRACPWHRLRDRRVISPYIDVPICLLALTGDTAPAPSAPMTGASYVEAGEGAGNRARLVARRQGYKLIKRKGRDLGARTSFMIVDIDSCVPRLEKEARGVVCPWDDTEKLLNVLDGQTVAINRGCDVLTRILGVSAS